MGHMMKDVMLLFNCQVVSSSFASPGTGVRQAFLSMEFHRQECWSELPFPSPGDLSDPEIEPWSFVVQVVSCTAGGFFTN